MAYMVDRSGGQTSQGRRRGSANLASSLPRRRSSRDPMRDFDRLPQPLRQWMTEAALPWSARSCLRLWRRAVAEGLTPQEALARLSAAEGRLLQRDGHALHEAAGAKRSGRPMPRD